MSTVGKIFSWSALRVGAGAKQVNFYHGFTSRAKRSKLLLLRPSKSTDRLILRRVVMPVSDGEARFRTIHIFFALDLAPPNFRHARPPKLNAEEVDVFRPRHPPSLRMVSSSVVPNFCFGGKAFCKSKGAFL